MSHRLAAYGEGRLCPKTPGRLMDPLLPSMLGEKSRLHAHVSSTKALVCESCKGTSIPLPPGSHCDKVNQKLTLHLINFLLNLYQNISQPAAQELNMLHKILITVPQKSPPPHTWSGSWLACQDLPLWQKAGVCQCLASMSITTRARLRSCRTKPCCSFWQ